MLFNTAQMFKTFVPTFPYSVHSRFASRFSKASLWSPKPGKSPKYVSAAEAVTHVKSGSSIFVNSLSGTPTELLDALCDRVDNENLNGISLSHTLLGGRVPWIEKKYWGKMRSNCLFMSSQMREVVSLGHADYTPIFLSDVARLCENDILAVDVCMLSVSPPDDHGFCTLGCDIHHTPSALEKAKLVIALVNPNVPRTFGDSQLHVSHIDYLVPSTASLYGFPHDTTPNKEELEIGRHIAEKLVVDGATLQLGVGGTPSAVLEFCESHKDLGVHSEVISDGIVDLLKKGVITNKKKTYMPGKIVSTLAFGSEEFYKNINNNTAFYMGHSAFTNNIEVIRMNSKMTSINGAIEVDLTGQVVSDSIGTKFFSGFGGQVDFVTGTGSTLDGEGKTIIALTSRTSNGNPKIVPVLKEGAGVVTTRGHVHYVVTEYGIAHLFGRNVRQRARLLIDIAHPEDRELLEKKAYERLKCMPSM